MSSSRHPVALRLEQQVGGATRLLATVMLLPLVDGIFAVLVLAGALDTWAGVAQVGLLVFGGSATLAVILAEMADDTREQIASVLVVGVPLIVIAAVEAALAPTIATVVDTAVLERFAALVILAVAAKTASATIGDYLPRPGVIIGLGFLASLRPGQAALVVAYDTGLLVHAVAAAGVAVAFALAVVALQPYLRDVVDIDRFRFGSAVALATLALSVFELVPSQAPLLVFGVAGLLAFDPGDVADEVADHGADGEAPDATRTTSADGNASGGREGTATTDGGSEPDGGESGDGYPGDASADERAPWL